MTELPFYNDIDCLFQSFFQNYCTKINQKILTMTEKNCNVCGMIIQQTAEMCETCAAMMGVQNPPLEIQTNDYFSQIPTNSFQSNSATTIPIPAEQIFIPTPNFIHSTEPKTVASPPNYQSNTINPPRSFAHQKPIINSTVKSNYKAGLLDWFWDLPGIVKFGSVILIFSILFGVALKGFMQLDVSIGNADTSAILEVQKPWFSSWYRSNPTPEEIFNKYETLTMAKGKKTSAQNFVITATAHFITFPAGQKVDLINLYKNKEVSKSIVDVGRYSIAESPFEFTVKAPDKWLLKTTTDFQKDPFTPRRTPVISGYDGLKIWNIRQTQFNGKTTTEDLPITASNYYLNRTGDGFSLTFQFSNFVKPELVSETVIYNRKSYNIKAKNAFGDESNIYFDVETGLVTQISQKDSTIYVIDHQEFDGILLPSKLVCGINGEWVLLEIQKIQTDVLLTDSIFLRTSY